MEIQDGVLKILSKSDNIVVCDFKEPEGFVIRAGIPSDAP